MTGGSAAESGDFAQGHYKGQCADDDYAAGMAYTAQGARHELRTPWTAENIRDCR
jgi:hypothetical protein